MNRRIILATKALCVSPYSWARLLRVPYINMRKIHGIRICQFARNHQLTATFHEISFNSITTLFVLAVVPPEYRIVLLAQNQEVNENDRVLHLLKALLDLLGLRDTSTLVEYFIQYCLQRSLIFLNTRVPKYFDQTIVSKYLGIFFNNCQCKSS